MSDPFIGEIKMFAGTFAPRGFAFCDGQLLAISQYQALFSLLGTTYGGDGRTTFALPDLRGRAPIHAGHGPGLSDRRLGSRGGSETNTLTQAEMPTHTHGSSMNSVNITVTPKVATGTGSQSTPENNVPASAERGTNIYSNTANAVGQAAEVQIAGNVTIQNAGGSQPVNNMQPFTTINYIIALEGIYPSRS